MKTSFVHYYKLKCYIFSEKIKIMKNVPVQAILQVKYFTGKNQ